MCASVELKSLILFGLNRIVGTTRGDSLLSETFLGLLLRSLTHHDLLQSSYHELSKVRPEYTLSVVLSGTLIFFCQDFNHFRILDLLEEKVIFIAANKLWMVGHIQQSHAILI